MIYIANGDRLIKVGFNENEDDVRIVLEVDTDNRVQKLSLTPYEARRVAGILMGMTTDKDYGDTG